MSRDLRLCNMATNSRKKLERSQNDDEKGQTEKEVTEKSNEQENVKNIAKFAGIDRHQRSCSCNLRESKSS